MFEISPNDCITVQEKILYNIMKYVEPLHKTVEPQKEQTHEITRAVGKCPVCGKEWKNKGQRLACIRKHKKEGKKV